MRKTILTLGLFASLYAFAQQERISNPDASSWINPYANGGSWNEFHFHRVERATDVLATNTNVIRCFLGKEFEGKVHYGYASNDCGTAQSIIPCPEPGSQYTFAARARVNAALGGEEPGKVFVEFVNSVGVKIRTVEFEVSNTSYTNFTQTFSVPSDAIWCHVWILKNEAENADLLVDWVSLKTADPDDTPAVPTGLSATAYGSTMVRLQWNAVAGARGYKIERKYDSDNSSKWKTVVKTFEGGGQTNFLDAVDTSTVKVLEPGIKYDYRISALGDYGNSGVSSTMSVTLATRSSSPGGTAYYIDASGGDDSNAGTSEGAAWQSFIPLDKVNLAAGDSVLLKRGESWNEPMQLHGGGAPGNEIVVASYGTSTNKPVINVETKAHAAIRMIDVSNCIVSDLELSNWHPFHRKTRRYALEAGEWQANSVSNLTFSNLFINGVRSVANRGDGGSASDGNIGAGIRIVGNVRQPTKDVYGLLSDITITECVLDNIEMFGIQLHDVDNALISSNTTDRMGFTATLSRRLSNSTVSHNTFQRAGYYETSDDNAHIGFYGGTNVVVEHNLIDTTYNPNSGQSMNYDGCDGYIVQHNYMKDSGAGSIVVNRTGGMDNVFRYNVSEGIESTQWFRNLGNRNLRIYNNTVYLKPGQDIQFISNGYGEGTTDPSTNVWCHNNIFYSAGGTITKDLVNNAAGTVNINISNNVYYGTFTDTPTEDENPLYADPLFAGPVGSENPDAFQLQTASPYIGTGLLIAGNGGQDFWGNPVSAAEAPSIGAHEPVSTIILFETFNTDPGVVFDPKAQITNEVGWSTWIGAHNGDCAHNTGHLKMAGKDGATRGWSISLHESIFADEPTNYRLTYHYSTLENASNNYLNVGIWEADIGSGGTANWYELDTYGAAGVAPGVNKSGNASKTKLGNWLTATGAVSTTEVVIEFSTDGTQDIAILFANMSAGGTKGTIYLEDIMLEAVPEAASTYADWAADYSLSYGPDGDDDNDGLSNLYEYGLGGNPTNGTADGNLPTFGNAGAGMEYIYARRTDDADLIYYLELSEDLMDGIWTNNGYTVTGTNLTSGTFDYITNSISSMDDQKFIKLIIEQ